jgi:hypothetical protein
VGGAGSVGGSESKKADEKDCCLQVFFTLFQPYSRFCRDKDMISYGK